MKRLYGKKIIFIERDPRSIVFSYYFRLIKRMEDKRVEKMPISDFIRDNTYGISRIVRYMNDWYGSRDKFGDFILFRYEDCVRDPELQYSRILEYLEAPVDSKTMKLALTSSVDTTRKIEEGGMVRDAGVEHDIARGAQYFETTGGDEASITRYAGDAAAYAAAFSVEDQAFMDAELSKLHPDFGYGRGAS